MEEAGAAQSSPEKRSQADCFVIPSAVPICVQVYPRSLNTGTTFRSCASSKPAYIPISFATSRGCLAVRASSTTSPSLNVVIIGAAAVAIRQGIASHLQLQAAREEIARLAVAEERLRFARDPAHTMAKASAGTSIPSRLHPQRMIIRFCYIVAWETLSISGRDAA